MEKNQVSPQSMEDVEKNHGDVRLAKRWITYYDVFEPDDGTPPPIECCIWKCQASNTIFVLWYVVGDEQSAREAWNDLVDGRWEGNLL